LLVLEFELRATHLLGHASSPERTEFLLFQPLFLAQ
jgi:hypothetical protein